MVSVCIKYQNKVRVDRDDDDDDDDDDAVCVSYASIIQVRYGCGCGCGCGCGTCAMCHVPLRVIHRSLFNVPATTTTTTAG